MKLGATVFQPWLRIGLPFPIACLVLVNISLGQSVLSGRVQSWDAVNQSGCAVTLKTQGDSVQTNTQGQFTITGLPTGIGLKRTLSGASVHYTGGALQIKLSSPMPVSMEVFEPSGTLLKRKNFGLLGAGDHSVRLPNPGRLSDGIRLLKLKIGNRDEEFKIFANESGHPQALVSQNAVAGGLLKGGAALDTLIIQCSGFMAKKIEITNYQIDLGVINVRPPNVILIYLDDSGYDDYSILGQRNFSTPNIDRLANEGALFTHYYSAASACSQSRAALLTGTYPARYRFPWVVSQTATAGLPEQEKTIAEILREKRYVTAIFGKWHLGNVPLAWPLNHGFDEFFGIPRSGDYDGVSLLRGNNTVSTYNGFAVQPNIGKNGLSINGIPQYHDTSTQKRLTEWFTNESIRFITTNNARPFFLYLAYNQPHVGLFVHDDFRGRSGVGLFSDVMVELDARVGQVMNVLKSNNIDDQTLVFFSSDNGPWLEYGNHAGTEGPFKRGFAKRTSHEAGVHMPGFIRFPGAIQPNSIINTPVMAIDILPTISKMVNGTLPPHKIDGVDLSPLLFEPRGQIGDRLLYIYEGNALQAIRHNNFKYHYNYATDRLNTAGMNGAPGSYTTVTQPEAVYNLTGDIAEANNVLSSNLSEANYIKSVATGFNDSLQNLSLQGRPIQNY